MAWLSLGTERATRSGIVWPRVKIRAKTVDFQLTFLEV